MECSKQIHLYTSGPFLMINFIHRTSWTAYSSICIHNIDTTWTYQQAPGLFGCVFFGARVAGGRPRPAPNRAPRAPRARAQSSNVKS